MAPYSNTGFFFRAFQILKMKIIFVFCFVFFSQIIQYFIKFDMFLRILAEPFFFPYFINNYAATDAQWDIRLAKDTTT